MACVTPDGPLEPPDRNHSTFAITLMVKTQEPGVRGFPLPSDVSLPFICKYTVKMIFIPFGVHLG